MSNLSRRFASSEPEKPAKVLLPPKKAEAPRPELVATVKKGRPKSGNPKVPLTVRLDQKVVDALKALGPEWRTEAEKMLRRALNL